MFKNNLVNKSLVFFLAFMTFSSSYLFAKNDEGLIKYNLIQNYLNSSNAQIELVIDKQSKTLQLFKDNSLSKTYPVALGIDSVTDKVNRGDGATPEGVFRIMDKHLSKYFTWFLELNYPTAEDAERGLNAGLISDTEYDRILIAPQEKTANVRNTNLGDAIGIHTSGRESKYGEVTDSNWTLGCIALEYVDMKTLYKEVSINTPVLVIGNSIIDNFKFQQNLMKNIDLVTLDIENKLKINQKESAKSQLIQCITEYEFFNKTKKVPVDYKLNHKASFLYHYLSFLEYDSDSEEAYAHAKTALELRPTSNPYKQNLAKSICVANKYEELDLAASLLEDIDKENINNNTEFQIISANIEFLKGNLDEAKRIVEEISVNPQYSKLFSDLAENMDNGFFDYQIYSVVRLTPLH